MYLDHITLIVTVLLVLIGAGLFRVGLYHLHFKDEPRPGARKGWLFIALGVCFGLAAVLTLVLLS